MDIMTKAILADVARLKQEIVKLNDEIEYFRTAACYLAGYFTQHALDTGIPLTDDIDLVEWAVLMANTRAK